MTLEEKNRVRYNFDHKKEKSNNRLEQLLNPIWVKLIYKTVLAT